MSTGGWHPTAAADILRGFHETVDPTTYDLQDYHLWHPIVYGLLCRAIPHSSGSNIADLQDTQVDHWFCELDGHGIYPPEDLAGNDFHWETVLDTSWVWPKGDHHIIRTALTKEWVYISIRLHGCWGQASPVEYVRFPRRD